MKQRHEIRIRVPVGQLFATASDVVRWPEFLSHYRFNRFLNHKASGGTVKMSCVRAGVVVTWIADFRMEPRARELHFQHLRSSLHTTRGRSEVWRFEEIDDFQSKLSIESELRRKFPFLPPALSDLLMGRYFFGYVAKQTLAGFKRKLESQIDRPALALPSNAA